MVSLELFPRSLLMTARALCLLAFALLMPLAVFAQNPTGATCPPEVERALRARVDEFLQYHVDSNFRKAFEMVAEETKDEYFASGKTILKEYKTDSIRFAEDCAKAVATSTVTRNWGIRLQQQTVVVPMTTTWKIENGKWM